MMWTETEMLSGSLRRVKCATWKTLGFCCPPRQRRARKTRERSPSGLRGLAHTGERDHIVLGAEQSAQPGCCWETPCCSGSAPRIVAAGSGPSRRPDVGLLLELSRRSADDKRASAAAARLSRSGRAYLAESLAARAEDVVRADADGRQPSCSPERSSLLARLARVLWCHSTLRATTQVEGSPSLIITSRCRKSAFASSARSDKRESATLAWATAMTTHLCVRAVVPRERFAGKLSTHESRWRGSRCSATCRRRSRQHTCCGALVPAHLASR
jgi:hypothetical protein